MSRLALAFRCLSVSTIALVVLSFASDSAAQGGNDEGASRRGKIEGESKSGPKADRFDSRPILTDKQWAKLDGAVDNALIFIASNTNYGNVYSSAITVLTLTPPYQLLPIYQR